MTKSESNNTFGEGLMMDMNPLTTPNTVMTNCLNGTLITFNGNEYILQNDMGNGRVETAFLPEGFVPLGTTELGGIIYIVSYNPNTNRCQIGSFPSPERNITSDEVENSPVIELNNKDFGYVEGVGARVYYLKKNLNSNLTFNPGDKFIVYGDTIGANMNKIQGIDYDKKDLLNETIRLYIGTITSDGKLIVFDNLKRFKIDDSGHEYYIYQYDGKSQSDGKPGLDKYRSLVSQPYNIFNSKISGELVVIAELVQCNSFEAQISHKFDTNKNYIPDVTFKFGGEYRYFPYGVQCKFKLVGSVNTQEETVEFKSSINTPSENFEYTETVYDIFKNTKTIGYIPKGYFEGQERDPLVLTYEFTPCMNWGPVKYLTVRGQIDLAKLGTGIIELNSWKYFNADNKCSLTWGLDVYEEEGCEVSDVKFHLTRLVDSNKTPETITYSINKKPSYHGTFYEIIPFNKEYYRFEKKGEKLSPNDLYLVQIEVYYGKVNKDSREATEVQEPRRFYRWLYTNSYFNDYYYKEEDYNGLSLNFGTKVKFGYNTTTTPSLTEYYGTLKAKVLDEGDDDITKGNKEINNTNLDSKTSMSAAQTVKEVSAECTAEFVLEKDYGSFSLLMYDKGANLTIDQEKVELTVTSDFKYTDREDSEYKKYLKNHTLKNWNGTAPNLSKATPDDLINGTNYGNGLKITDTDVTPTYNSATNTYSFDLKYTLLELTKAYCSKQKKLLSYSGRFIPLCYNADQFSEYNLTNENGKWVPSRIGIFSFKEPGGEKGLGYIGAISKEKPSEKAETQYKKANDLDINFGTDADIVTHENNHGWANTAMFVAHYGTGKNKPSQGWKVDRNTDWVSYSSSGAFSVDPCSDFGSDRHLVILMMQSAENDGRFYPINFCYTTKMNNNPSNYFSSTGYYYKLYQMFAQILTNIYKYEAESFSQNFIIPDSVYYGDNYRYNVNIPLNITVQDTTKAQVQIRLEDKSLFLLKDFETIIPEKDKGKVNIANITATINNVKGKSSLTIQDTNYSSLTLRNHIMDEADVNLGNVVYDFDGSTVLGEQSGNFKSTELYCRQVTKSDGKVAAGNIIEKATTFKPVNIGYDSSGNALATGKGSGTSLLYKTKNGSDWTKEEYSKQELTKDFALSEQGYLVIKTPNKLGIAFKRDGNHDTGSVTGYQRIGFGQSYKAW